MTPDTLNFTGDAVTYLGLIGVISTLIIVVTSFRRYFNSPLRKWSKMKLTNKAQFSQFVENYVSHIVDGMDVDTLETMVFDLLCREYETYTEEQIVGEIEELYGEEVAQDLLESATAVPVE